MKRQIMQPFFSIEDIIFCLKVILLAHFSLLLRQFPKRFRCPLINFSIDMAEAQISFITGCSYPFRGVLGRRMIPDKKPKYFHLITTLSKKEAGLKQFLKLNGVNLSKPLSRRLIALHLHKLRVRRINGIKFFLTLSLLSYNFISWYKRDLFVNSHIAHIGVNEFIEQVMRIPAHW